MATPLVERPLPGPLTATDSGARMVALRANLLPDEIVSARAADRMRRKALVALAAVAALMAMWFALSWFQTSGAEDDLAAAQNGRTALQRSTAKYAPLVSAKAETSAITEKLKRLMVGDTSWKDMLTTLRAKAPTGVQLDQITGQLTTAAVGTPAGSGQAATGFGVLNDSDVTTVGTMGISGTAPSKTAIAAYADRLSRVPGLTAPVITNFLVRDKDVTFTLSANLTSAALGGKYAVPAAKQGGN